MKMLKINLMPFLKGIFANNGKRQDILKRCGIKLQSLVRPKIFWPTIFILLITSVVLYILKEKEKDLRIYTEKELSETVEAKKVVENNLTKAKKEIVAKDEQIRLTLNKLEKEIAARKDIEVDLILVTKEKMALEVKVEELTAALPKNIDLEKIVIKSMDELTGKVLAFDKENSFVIIDLGRVNNLKLGDVLSVYHDDEFIGKVQVEKVEEETSAAVILTPWKKVEFKESDIVKRI